VVQISAGGAHTCARLQGGALRCWGNGALGRLGYGNEDDIGDDEAPAIAGDVPVGAAVTFVGAGSGHTCAVLESGGVRCWGFGFGGRLGQGNLDDIGDDETPASVATVPLPGRFLDMSLGAHSCVRDAVGDVYCWGGNLYGQLGLGHTDDIGDDEPPSMAPVLVGDAVVAMSSGGDHNCVVTKAGTVRCWGRGEDGRLGYLATSNVGDDELPTATGDVSVGGIALGIAGGFRHSCAILDTGAVRCWGSNGSGQLGYGKPDSIGDDEMPAAAGDVPFLD
jgi:alpha-tubulin suppressor-like RCC1 family protein